jgi:hypothetical protein
MMLEIGQKLWFVPSDRRWSQPREVTVTKIGRKWAYTNRYRNEEKVDKETLVVSGGGYASPGRCWLSQEEYEAHAAADREWRRLKNDMPWSVPNGVTVEKIGVVRRLLGLSEGPI